MIVYVKNIKTTTKELLEFSSNCEFSTVTGHQVNTEKLFVFLYTSNKAKIKSKKLSFAIKEKSLKYMQDFYTVISKHFSEKLKKTQIKPYSLTGRFNIAKMSIFPWLIYGFNTTSTKTSEVFLFVCLFVEGKLESKLAN